jgi:hypothetical protein
VRYFNFLEKYASFYRGARPHAEVALLFPRSRVHQGDVNALAAFRDLGKELLDRHVLFDIIPDDITTPALLGRYQVALRATDEKPLAALAGKLSRFDAPATVRVSANRGKDGKFLTLHFVNYNREEPKQKKSAGRGIVDEKPIAVKQVGVDLAWPERTRLDQAYFLTPENTEPIALKLESTNTRLRFRVPEFLVYAVAVLPIE